MKKKDSAFFDVSRFGRCRVLVLGDLMMDEYLWGEVDRISPEAPVQVVSVREESTTLGGAGNVVNNLATLGAQVSVLGVVGQGTDGDHVVRMLADRGVDADGVIRDPDRITTKKTRVIASSQHVLRIDRDAIRPISPEQAERLCGRVKEKISETDVVLVSDYGKGLLTRGLLLPVLEECRRRGTITIVDPKGLDFSKYRGAHTITPNKKEAAQASGVPVDDDASLDEAALKLLSVHGFDQVLVTCGKEGMVLFTQDFPPCRISAQARQVYDVSGAGDTVLAVLGLAVASGASFEQAARLANTAAGIVVGKVGTATVRKDELQAALAPVVDAACLKYKDFEDLALAVAELKKKGKRVVLTNGCFDLLHAGHIGLFEASRRLGDLLVVAVDDDDSVRSLKGPGRPVLRERERVRIISALDTVDYVTVFSGKDILRLIRLLKPDILTKGSDYTAEKVYGRELVEELGGRVELVPLFGGVSSSRIIDEIRNGPLEGPRCP